jgi:hypothetical protein
MHRLGDWIIVALLVSGFPCLAQADALKRAGAAVHGNDDRDEDRGRHEPRRESHSQTSSGGYHRSTSSEERHHSHERHAYRANGWHDDDDGYDDSEGDRALGRAALQVLFFPWTLPAAVVREYNVDGYSIPVYPYADEPAYTVGGEDAPSEVKRVARLRLRLGATARSPQLVSGTLATQLDFSLPFTLRLDYRLFAEADGGTRSYAGLGNAEVLYRFAESAALCFFTGAGYVQWADVSGLSHGFGLIYGFEAFPIRPITFGSRLSIGKLGASYSFQWRSYIGVMISRYEVQVAYDHVDVGGAQLGGLQLSLEAHL